MSISSYSAPYVVWKCDLQPLSEGDVTTRRQQNKADWDELGNSQFIYAVSMGHMLRDEPFLANAYV